MSKRNEKPFRILRYETLAEAMQEAERLATLEVTTSGSFSAGQIYDHLARVIDWVTGELKGSHVPWFVKVIARLIRHGKIHKPLPRGFKLPKKPQSVLWASEPVSTELGLEHLRKSYKQFVETKELPAHPLFGKISQEDHHQLQCRHFELHLGFIHPKG